MEDHYYERDTIFNLQQEKIEFSRSISPQFIINLDFFFKPEDRIYIVNQDFILLQSQTSFRCSHDRTSVAVPVITSSWMYDDIRAAVGEAIAGHVFGAKRDELIALACEEVRVRSFAIETLPQLEVVLHLYFHVQIIHRLIYLVESDGSGMVPAADSSFAMLEKYEGDCVEDCCICLEELAGTGKDNGGGGALRMPCWHAFHGGCIQEWLTTSHYCPLCRYEMPTQ